MTCGRINELYEFQPFLRFWVVRLPVAYYSGATYDVSTLLEILVDVICPDNVIAYLAMFQPFLRFWKSIIVLKSGDDASP